ncbi:hypothetical protein [Amycolatopsis jiangsuensis]|uniref:MoaA/NifB/PqqE/SkfB family radical SAM enzyme n=1 Tax=Amycolatopsis jiangsuensis TaxID=1181879 RepID=A0A840J6G2_9PSEU|nr:hypothetical protein [Amycolatopsis jiangsuensis]MBB4689620.1 MoaA/NifB/PqqE/SkfB family radical SAM enzyme [Amycolatopsis jiangsuensis]
MQISCDGVTEEVNDPYAALARTAVRAMERLRSAGLTGFKLTVAANRQNTGQLDGSKTIAVSP